MKTISWHWFMDKRFMNAILFFGLIALGTACTDDSDQNSPSSNGSADKGKVGTFDAPIVSCVGDPAKTTQTSITVRVTAGNSGAPAGFSLQWLTKTEYDLNGWGSAVLCKASFSGNANEHVFNLSPNGYIDVTLGDVLFDTPGASSDCIFDLECGTEYVFRAFAHATSTMFKSGWSANQICSTESCVENCVYGQGYWQRHGPVPPGQSEILYIWPQDVKDNGMMLGTVHYTAAQLQDINYATGATNGLVKLAHQLIAAKLNIANGADGTSIAATITAADALIGSRVIPPVGSGSLTNAQVAALNEALTAYNEGDGGVEFCADEED